MKIIGRSRGARSFTTNPIAFVNYRLAQALLPQELHNRTTYILVKLAPGADPEAVRGELTRRLPHHAVWTRAEWAARSRAYWIINTGLGLSMYVTVFLGALVGVVIVAQTLYTSTIERSAEFAIIKAIGGSNAHIYRLVAAQAALAAVVGFGLGAAMAYAIRPVLMRLELKTILPPELAAAVGLGTLALCLLASAISLRRIVAVDPALVFRR